MRLGRRLSTGIAEDPPAPSRAEPVTAEPVPVPTEPSRDEVHREYVEASER